MHKGCCERYSSCKCFLPIVAVVMKKGRDKERGGRFGHTKYILDFIILCEMAAFLNLSPQRTNNFMGY